MSDDGFDSLAVVLGAADAFDASPQAATRLLDDRATALIKTNPSSPTP